MEIIFSDYEFRTRMVEEKQEIFDIVRKKFVALTPEEWVRQHFLHFLTADLNYPKSLISVEKQLKYNNLPRRTDVVLYNREGAPKLIIECKAPNLEVNQSTFEQIARYNLKLKAEYLVVSNGTTTYGCQVDIKKQSYQFIDSFPKAEEVIGLI